LRGGGSNAIACLRISGGISGPHGRVEAGGRGIRRGGPCRAICGGRLEFCKAANVHLQDADGQVDLTHSVSAGLDYAAVGPEHAFYRDRGRIEFAYETDDEVLATFQLCSGWKASSPPSSRRTPWPTR